MAEVNSQERADRYAGRVRGSTLFADHDRDNWLPPSTDRPAGFWADQVPV